MNEIYGYIYGLMSPIGKWYIGQTTQSPFSYINREYKNNKVGKIIKINRAIVKYGFEKFTIALLDSSMKKEYLDKKEIEYVTEYDSLNNGYNYKEGGSYGKPSEESRKK